MKMKTKIEESGHKLHKCNEPTCTVCNGGLSLCETCGGAEASLPNACPGRKMSSIEQNMVQSRELNFMRVKVPGQINFANSLKSPEKVLGFCLIEGEQDVLICFDGSKPYDQPVSSISDVEKKKEYVINHAFPNSEHIGLSDQNIKSFDVYGRKLAVLDEDGLVTQFNISGLNSYIHANKVGTAEIPKENKIQFLGDGNLHMFKPLPNIIPYGYTEKTIYTYKSMVEIEKDNSINNSQISP